jgi:site-specific recombinase XerD
MIDRLFVFESTRTRYRAAPFSEQREAFLTYLYDQQVPVRRLKSIAAIQLQIVRLLDLSSPRMLSATEIRDAARRWRTDPHETKSHKAKDENQFHSVCTRWFKFAGLISATPSVKTFSDTFLEDFRWYLVTNRNLSEGTIRPYYYRLKRFLSWAKGKSLPLSKIALCDIDEYLKERIAAGFRPRTIASMCAALRAFFIYAAQRNVNINGIANRIERPRIDRHDSIPKGPMWRDVRRMLDQDFGMSVFELRASGIISLCAIYALRSCEVISLKLEDLDWEGETLRLVRAKSRRVQRLPLQFEVGEAIIKYLRFARPKCACRNLFISIRPPYRPMNSCSTWVVVSRRLQALGIPSKNYGAHSLRHSCATYLLSRGVSLAEIADFLGHSDLKSVSIYAKHDSKSLREVANFSITGAM